MKKSSKTIQIIKTTISKQLKEKRLDKTIENIDDLEEL
jgi:hypothetical protein